MQKKPDRTVKCSFCGREFIEPIPHRCNRNYRKRNLKWINIMKEEKRKQFNVEEFISNTETPVETRDGRKVTIISTERNYLKRIVGDIHNDICGFRSPVDGVLLCDWYGDGSYCSCNKDPKDLFFSVKKKKRRMTNRELAWWLREHQEEHREACGKVTDCVFSTYTYWRGGESCPCPDEMLIRRNGGEWEEPLIEIKEEENDKRG